MLALCMMPAAWFAGRVDKMPLPPKRRRRDRQRSAAIALAAVGNPPFVVMTLAYFVCGMQLVFLTTHLPSYLALCGMDPMLSAQALGMIGGFNMLGSLFFGWAGGRWNKLALLGGLYITRSIALAWYFVAPPTPTTHAGVRRGHGLPVARRRRRWSPAAIAEMFGLRWQPMIQGRRLRQPPARQLPRRLGGGLLYDALGSYTLAWQIGVALGLTAGIVQVAFALLRPTAPPMLKTA